MWNFNSPYPSSGLVPNQGLLLPRKLLQDMEHALYSETRVKSGPHPGSAAFAEAIVGRETCHAPTALSSSELVHTLGLSGGFCFLFLNR